MVCWTSHSCITVVPSFTLLLQEARMCGYRVSPSCSMRRKHATDIVFVGGTILHEPSIHPRTQH